MAGKEDFKVGNDISHQAESDDLQTDRADVLAVETDDPVYDAKARVLNRAVCVLDSCRLQVMKSNTTMQIQDVGMGWYQWQLFIVIGFGWASDNLWPIVTSLIFTPITNEFSPK